MGEFLIGPGGMSPEVRRHVECPFCQHMDTLREALVEAKLWLDVQPEDSGYRDKFRRRIRFLTDERLLTEERRAAAAALRPQVARAEQDFRASRRRLDNAGGGTKPSGVAIAAGTVLVLFGVVVFGWWPMWLVGLVLIVTGVVGLYFSTRSRRVAEEAYGDDQAALDELDGRIDELMPDELPPLTMTV